MPAAQVEKLLDYFSLQEEDEENADRGALDSARDYEYDQGSARLDLDPSSYKVDKSALNFHVSPNQYSRQQEFRKEENKSSLNMVHEDLASSLADAIMATRELKQAQNAKPAMPSAVLAGSKAKLQAAEP